MRRTAFTKRRRCAAALALPALLAASGTALAVTGPADAAVPATGAAAQLTSVPPLVRVSGTRFVDAQGREVVLRGFNVSGDVKLAENGFLPFANAADARTSAQAMKNLTGANAVRFLLSWAAVEPAPGKINTDYLQKVVEQARPFADLGFSVFFDYHQDLYSRAIFTKDSWYSGDGAPAWVIAAGNYPKESCGVCVNWGQNITQNDAVMSAEYDFWHNRVLDTSAGKLAVQDEFLRQAGVALAYLRTHLTADQYAHVVGFDPLNEPYAGKYDSGQTSRTWERDLLMPFYTRFRAVMDDAGWQDRPAFVEPNLFWNSNLSFARQEGGLLDSAPLGSRFAFNTHFYDHAAISGVFMWGKAGDGQYSSALSTVRDRGTALNTPAIVTEYGHPLTGYTSDKAPSVSKAIYQALDSRLPGSQWWSKPAESGSVLSGTQWHWDIYSGQHHEAMNDDTGEILTDGDAWNGEDFSTMKLDSAGTPVLREDARLLDRVFPAAVAGQTLAFTYEDRSRDGSSPMAWNAVSNNLPSTQSLVSNSRYGVLVWRSNGSGVPTQLHVPAGYRLTVVSDVASTVDGSTLELAADTTSGALHVALLSDGPVPSASLLAASRTELASWAATAFH